MSSNPEYLVAIEPLMIGTVRAHNPGDLVRSEDVEAHGWADQVVRPGTKAAEKAAGEPGA